MKVGVYATLFQIYTLSKSPESSETFIDSQKTQRKTGETKPSSYNPFFFQEKQKQAQNSLNI